MELNHCSILTLKAQITNMSVLTYVDFLEVFLTNSVFPYQTAPRAVLPGSTMCASILKLVN